MLRWFTSLFSGPKPAGPPQVLRTFAADKPTITQASIRAEQGAWRIDATGEQTIRLFEVEDPGVEQCLLTYRAELKAEGLKGRAFSKCGVAYPVEVSSSPKAINMPSRARSTGLATRSLST